MSRLISGKPDNEPPKPRGAPALFIGGIRYANAAAKFWSSIIDEVREDFPGCTSIELSASSAGELCRDLLFPQRSLERAIEEFAFRDLDTMIKGVVAEMELLGPPSAVQVRLASETSELFSGSLPLECVDAEIFPHLIVWPLAWSGVPDEKWNDAEVDGEIKAEDRRRRIGYDISFVLSAKHISEGLYLRAIAVNPTVDALPESL